MKEYILENKKIIIIITIFIMFLIILSIIVKLLGTTNNILISNYISKLEKEDINLNIKDCNLDNVLKNNNIPYFNLNNQVFNNLNEEILETFLLRSCYQNGQTDYEVTLNKNILSLAIQISYETIDDLAYLEYKTYNIDTNTNTKLSNQNILNLYNLTIQDVNNKVTSKLQEYYQYEKDKNYLDNQTFNDYLKILEYENITYNNMNLFIDNKNDLYIYKEYTLSEGMIIDEEFPEITIKFKLT